jgi:hypothetical protein
MMRESKANNPSRMQHQKRNFKVAGVVWIAF